MNEVPITGTLIWYYYICKREVWLMAHHLEPDEDNPLIELGRFISDTTYKRDKKQIDLAKLDDEKLVIGEVKKSSTFRDAARMQLCYYLYVLRDYGIEAEGELLFPKEKKREKVILTDETIREIEGTTKEIRDIVSRELPPPAVRIGYCTNCGYREFCWS
jgi:CRISPR-associated exonuclease Cas4